MAHLSAHGVSQQRGLRINNEEILFLLGSKHVYHSVLMKIAYRGSPAAYRGGVGWGEVWGGGGVGVSGVGRVGGRFPQSAFLFFYINILQSYCFQIKISNKQNQQRFRFLFPETDSRTT
jgi:hypothetical protein